MIKIKEHGNPAALLEIEILRLAASPALVDANRRGKKAELFAETIFNIASIGKMQFRLRAAG